MTYNPDWGTGGGGITDLTGNVTASGTGSVVATIAADAVTNAKLADMAANSLKGNNTGAPANPADLTATQVKTLLAIANTDVSGLGTLATQSGTFSGTSSGTNTGDQTITLTGEVTGTGTGSFAATIANSAVTLAKQANLAANSIIGNNTGSPATPLALTAAQVKTLLAIAAGDVSGLGTLATQSGTFSGTSSGTNTGDNAVNSLYSGLVSNATHTGDVTGATALTIANDAVTYAKMQNVSGASRLLGRGSAGGAGDVEEVTLGANLTMTGTVLSASSGAGANTAYAPGSFTVATGNFALHCNELQLTTTQRMTLAGTARFRLMN